MRIRLLSTALACLSGITVSATDSLTDSLQYRVEMQSSLSSGDHTPLWLNANKYGLSSLKLSNGYMRAALEKPLSADTAGKWGVGYGIDMALAYNFTSSVVLQQAYIEGRWKHAVLTLGAKEYPLELKNQQLSTGGQTLGVNARPVPQLRFAVPAYYPLAFTRGLLSVKGHLSYGVTTDDRWQADFTQRQTKYTENTMYHSKAGFVKVGREGKPLSVEVGLEMACQFGGTSYIPAKGGGLKRIDNEDGIAALWHAFVPGGAEVVEDVYKNTSGNNLGSWLLRVNLDYDKWYLGLYADHFFEDHSQLYFLSYNGYGTGPEWDKKKDLRFAFYDLKDVQLGLELRLKRLRWLDNIVVEYLHTKYQSGAVYHDHTPSMPDNVFGHDDYYNHYIYTGWQHWGQVMGNPLYRSPIYNDDGRIEVLNNRFIAYHLGLSGRPVSGLSYRLLTTWQRGYGAYWKPFADPQETVHLLAEAQYAFPSASSLSGWSVKAGLGRDWGKTFGNNSGLQLTATRKVFRKTEKNKKNKK